MITINGIKAISDIVVSAGVASVVGNAIKASTPDDLKRFKKISITVGGFVLSGMVSGMATKYTNEQIDAAASVLKGVVKIAEAPEPEESSTNPEA
jgi:hypothetical protein